MDTTQSWDILGSKLIKCCIAGPVAVKSQKFVLQTIIKRRLVRPEHSLARGLLRQAQVSEVGGLTRKYCTYKL